MKLFPWRRGGGCDTNPLTFRRSQRYILWEPDIVTEESQSYQKADPLCLCFFRKHHIFPLLHILSKSTISLLELYPPPSPRREKLRQQAHVTKSKAISLIAASTRPGPRRASLLTGWVGALPHWTPKGYSKTKGTGGRSRAERPPGARAGTASPRPRAPTSSWRMGGDCAPGFSLTRGSPGAP